MQIASGSAVGFFSALPLVLYLARANLAVSAGAYTTNAIEVRRWMSGGGHQLLYLCTNFRAPGCSRMVQVPCGCLLNGRGGGVALGGRRPAPAA